MIYLYIKQESPLKEYDNERFDFINTRIGFLLCWYAEIPVNWNIIIQLESTFLPR